MRPPTSDRAGIDRLAYLDHACRPDRPLGFVELEAGIIPFETAMGNDTARECFEIDHQLLILHLEHLFQWQHFSPMLHQRRVGAVITAEFGEIISEEMIMGEKDRETR